MQRRNFMGLVGGTTLAGLVTSGSSFGYQSPAVVDQHQVSEIHIAPFRFDVTPPLGHGCCGNWIKPIEGYDDPMEAIGFVLLGAGKPIVVCSVDWTGLLNEAHVAWRTAMAEAAGTTQIVWLCKSCINTMLHSLASKRPRSWPIRKPCQACSTSISSTVAWMRRGCRCAARCNKAKR